MIRTWYVITYQVSNMHYNQVPWSIRTLKYVLKYGYGWLNFHNEKSLELQCILCAKNTAKATAT